MAVVQQQVASGRLRGFLSGAAEIDDAALRCEGDVPAWLRGTLLLNGPALWELPGGALAHWFDGFAMLHRLRFGADGVSYRSRYARSDAYTRSLAAGAPVYGEFGTSNPANLFARLKGTQGTDNPAVVMSRHGERWVAVTETPHLTYFDPDTLATGPRLDIDGPHLMSAHGFTLADGSYLNVGTALGPKCTVALFRVPTGAQRATTIAKVTMPKSGYTHGFALAPGHAIVWECAMRAQPLAFRFSAHAYKDNFRWEPDGGSAIHAMPLDGGPVRSWRIPAMFAFHACQAYADGADLVLEVVAYDDAGIFEELMLAPRRAGTAQRAVPRLVRYRLRPGTDTAEPEATGVSFELPQVHPDRIGQGRARIAWGAANGPQGEFLDRTVRVDLDSGAVTTWQRGGATQLEPLFVPRPGGSEDDDGVLLVPTLADGDEASVIAVLDARTMAPLARIHAPQVIPFGFHAAWAA
jgi:carotenoid cleavage dioxygenase-like enzyme